MKRALVLLSSLTLSAACAEVAEEAREQKPQIEGTHVGLEDWKANLPIDSTTGLYVVEDDILMPDGEELDSYYRDPNALTVDVGTQNSPNQGWDNVVPAAQRMNLTYCISNSFPFFDKLSVIGAMATAAQDWQNATNNNVRFVYVSGQDGDCTPSNGNVFFSVQPNNAIYPQAIAFLPNYPRHWRLLQIRMAGVNTPPYTLAGLLRHELGHVLGFRHEHVHANCSSDERLTPESPFIPAHRSWVATPYGAVTGYDSASVMHYPQRCGTNTGDLVLTTSDRLGARCMYDSTVATGACGTRRVFINGGGSQSGFRGEVRVTCGSQTCSRIGDDSARLPGCAINCPFPGNVTMYCSSHTPGRLVSDADENTPWDVNLSSSAPSDLMQLPTALGCDRMECSATLPVRSRGMNFHCSITD